MATDLGLSREDSAVGFRVSPDAPVPRDERRGTDDYLSTGNCLSPAASNLLAICSRLLTDYSDYGGTVVRWADDRLAYPDCSCGCRWARWLAGALGHDWCVCTKPGAPRVALLTFEHMAGFGCFEQNDDDETGI